MKRQRVFDAFHLVWFRNCGILRAMKITNLRTSLPVALLLLAACDEDPPNAADTTDTTTADATTDAGADTAADAVEDAPEEVTPDAEVDTAPDVVADTAEDTAPDIEDTADTMDAADVEVVDAGSSCADDPLICSAPYTCMDDVCRIPLADTTWAESNFDIDEPEELTALFRTFKSFANDVRFLVLDFGAGGNALPGQYGTADIVSEEEGELMRVAYQHEGAFVGNVIVRATETDDAPLAGNAWITDPFFYELRATAVIDFPGAEPINASFGLDAQDVEITLAVNEDGTEAEGLLIGVVTREEAEGRSMMDDEDFPENLFCSRYDIEPESGVWHLSDVLDCNDAEMDIDVDLDGTNDAYRVVISAEFEPATLVE